MNRETKAQHFVPSVYLASWDLQRPARSRNSRVWWTDGVNCDRKRVQNLAHQRYLYKRQNTQESEDYFGEFETDWPKLIEDFENGSIGNRVFGVAMLQAVVMACRNPSLKLTSKTGRFKKTLDAIDTTLHRILLNNLNRSSTPRELLNQLKENWNFQVFREAERF